MQQGGSQFGVSMEMPPFAGGGGLAEAASPISSRPPAAGPPPAGRGNFDELGPVMGSYTDDDTMGGEEAERGVSGNRWPRQETLALLKIRSEKDAVFRDATLKGPLWEDVSRKLAELGYSRSAKKCKEKFENVHKYYKRTKEGRAGRQDGKSYRFFSQLEALHSSSNTNIPNPIAAAPPPPPPPPPVPTSVAAAPPNNPTPSPVSVGIGGSNTMVGSSTRIQHPPPPVSAAPSTASTQINVPRVGSDLAAGVFGPVTAAAVISFSSNSSSSDSDSEDEIEERPTMDTRRRKRSASGVSSSQKKMAFFEGLMKEVMEKQEAMQQRFLDAIEKREQDRMVREEAWKRQEMARLVREHEIMMQERAMAASRDAAVIAFLQKMSGQTIQITQPVLIPAIPPPQPNLVPQLIPTLPPQPQQSHHHYQPPQQQQQQQHKPPQQQQQQQQHKPPQQSQNTEIIRHQPSSSELVVAQPEQQEMGVSFDTTSSSRWPKSEVLALIKLRSGLETRYQEAGPKGPLWEEISAGMHRLGFNRSSKRCKEKWENINKYFKKVKESNKKRPEDAKTCPYFHQLDALYRKKLLSGSGGSQTKQEEEQNQNQHLQERGEILAIMPPPPPQPQPEAETKNNNNNNKNSGDTNSGGSLQVQTSNGGLPPSFFEEGPMKKPEDIVKELMEQHQQQQSVMDDYDKLEEPDSDNLDQEDDDEEEDEEDRKMPYKIQYHRPNSGKSNSGGNAATTSFLAMVQKLSSS